ncbi:GntR family transcriptional regulator [Bordetella sp. BOR01]|uniref:GntR family transcriptional regulator n=1 Tax=Bordetella sp. BOR01 TaxID=2854779 RepID=UPI001C43C00A|nr:GntR family transcriptional regulator [Bordetella sp. BOR01]MBV7484732.1 GntR family transcriptional regulator [Bordetella sp. BOR01]
MRLTLNALPDLPVQAGPGVTLAGQAYELIKRDLFEFRMLPGDEFTESDLVARLGVSRTPVRQALYRLEREGFVLLRQRSGWRVRPFDFERFEALYDVRIVLEQAAVIRLCGLHDMDASGEMSTLKRIWLVPPAERLRGGRQVAELDEAFHCALVAAAGNPEMAQIHRDVTEKIRIIRQMDFTKDYRVDATYVEHGAILRAILARRADEAARMLKSHIEISKSEVRKITLHRMEMARREGLR